jgi:2-polyprenyl-6-methoxyphenol hydroxylase-like FAD-dependent oxidoreductase
MAAKHGFCMRYTDIAIIGAGLAGSTAAAMLGRAGISTILVDPHPVYPCDFRVEKLSGNDQLARSFKTGIAESVLRSTTHEGENWIARFGYLLDRKPSRQYGIVYDAQIQAIRAEIRAPAEVVFAKALSISPSAERQQITLSDGEPILARSSCSPTASISACGMLSASSARSSAAAIRSRSGSILPPLAARHSTSRR